MNASLHWGRIIPPNRKAHLFTRTEELEGDLPSGANGTNGRSLCGRIAFAFALPLDSEYATGNARGPDDCAECWRRAGKVKA